MDLLANVKDDGIEWSTFEGGCCIESDTATSVADVLDRVRQKDMGMQLWRGDCFSIVPHMLGGSVDAIITDPPYLKKYLPLYGLLAAEASRILKDGGSLLSIVPHYAIETVLVDVGKHLKYRWLFCMWQAEGSHPRMAMGIEVMWKPIGWWVKKSWPPGRGFVRDGLVNPPVNKRFHRWEQSEQWAEHCLKCVPRYGTVLDPFMGGGTTAVACHKSNRPYVGIDISTRAYEATLRRLWEIGKVFRR